MSTILTSRQAADLLEVHESTVKRWCDDGALAARRTRGGHRRIDLDHVIDFARSQEVAAPILGFSPYERAIWEATAALKTGDYTPVNDLAFGWLTSFQADLIEPLFRYLWNQVDLPLPLLFDRIMGPLLERLGSAWAQGQIGVGQEHFCTQVVLDALHRLRCSILHDRGPMRMPRLRAVVGCAEGEAHEIGAMATRLLLEARGWRVDYLGPNVPISEFAVLQRQAEARLVCISFVPPRAPADAHHTVRFLAQMYDPQAPYALALGGSGLGADYTLPPGDRPFADIAHFRSTDGFAGWIGGLTEGLVAERPGGLDWGARTGAEGSIQ